MEILLWDSGLAWQHGPETRESCADLLCGPNVWRERQEGFEDEKTFQCRRICTTFLLFSVSLFNDTYSSGRFSRTLVEKLRSVGPDAGTATKRTVVDRQ